MLTFENAAIQGVAGIIEKLTVGQTGALCTDTTDGWL